MSIVADRVGLVQAAPLAADDHDKTKEPLPQRPRGPHPYRSVRVGGAARTGDVVARALVAGWYVQFGPMVESVVARAVRPSDADVVEDLAQDVWVETYQYLLRGNAVTRPAGLLAAKARRRVARHYASARVRRELAYDFQDDYSAAVVRLASWIGAAA